MEFIGRSAQLDTLRSRFETVEEGRSNLAVVRGITGSGKSALMLEFLEQVQNESAATVALVSCNQYSEEPYSVFKRIVSEIAESEITDSRGRGKKAMSSVGSAMLELGPAFISLIFPPAGAFGEVGAYLLKRSQDSRRSAPADSGGYRDSFRDLSSDFVHFFKKVSSESAYVLVVDDIHWADRDSISLFGRLAGLLKSDRNIPILLVGSYRSHEITAVEDHPLGSVLNQVTVGWGDVVVDLDTVDDSERYEFTKNLIHGFTGLDLGDGLADQVFSRAEGNPLVVTELLTAMTAKGDFIGLGSGGFAADPDLEWGHVPIGFDASVSERMKRLTPEQRRVLDMASVQGSSFSAEIIANALGLNIDNVLLHLSALDKSHAFVDDDPSPPSHFEFGLRFRHAEYQRYTYSSLSQAVRKRAHQQVAKALTRIYPGIERELALETAGHWATGGKAELAAPYFLEAANSALDVQALPAAREAALRGLEHPLTGNPAVEAELHLIAGQAASVLGYYAAAKSHLQTSEQIARSQSLDNIETDAILWLGANAWRINEDQLAHEYLMSALARARNQRDRAAETRALRNLGVLARRAGDADGALDLYEQAERVAREAGVEAAVTAAMNNRAGTMAGLLGDFTAARDLFTQALEMARTCGNESGQALYSHNLAGELARLGELDIALQMAEDGLSLSQAVGNPRRESFCYVDLGEIQARLGHWADASENFRRSIAVSSGIAGQHPYVIRAYMGLALSAAHTPHGMPESLRSAETAMRLFNESGRRSISYLVHEPNTVLAIVRGRSGDASGVEALLQPDEAPKPLDELPWWALWQTSMNSIARAVLLDDETQDERCLALIKSALVACSAPGVLDTVYWALDLLSAVAPERPLITSALSLLATPNGDTGTTREQLPRSS